MYEPIQALCGDDVMIDFTITGGEQQVARLRNSRASILREVMIEVERLDAVVLSRVQEKLSGGMLQQRSGRLLGSAHKNEATSDGNTVIGGVEAGGGVAFYARFQAQGTKRPYQILPVTKLALAFFPSGSAGGAAIASGGRAMQAVRSLYTGYRTRPELKRNPKVLAAFSGLGGVVVKSVMHPGLQARPFMTQSLEETRGEIISGIEAAVQRGAAEA